MLQVFALPSLQASLLQNSSNHFYLLRLPRSDLIHLLTETKGEKGYIHFSRTCWRQWLQVARRGVGHDHSHDHQLPDPMILVLPLAVPLAIEDPRPDLLLRQHDEMGITGVEVAAGVAEVVATVVIEASLHLRRAQRYKPFRTIMKRSVAH